MKDIILSEKKPEYKIQAQLHLKEKKPLEDSVD